MFWTRAMRYYRVWIYACNVSLLAATLVFAAAFAWLTTDLRLQLFPGVRLYQPTFVYGLVALFLQAGVLQAIGCLGAVRMNERLLNLYYNVLVGLMFGDAIVGVVWLFRYNFIVTNLRSDLKDRLNNDYGLEAPFQDLWDRVQQEHQCCGVDGPIDYNLTNWFERNHREFPGNGHLVPRSCCRPMGSSSLMSSGVGGGPPGHHHHLLHPHLEREAFYCTHSYAPESIYTYGCYGAVLDWLQRSVNVLSVLGFCVLSFLKVCFACILKYEIQEMIQKIQILKGAEVCPGATPLHELEAYLPRPSITTANEQLGSSFANCPGYQTSQSQPQQTERSPQSTRMSSHDSTTPSMALRRNTRPTLDNRAPPGPGTGSGGHDPPLRKQSSAASPPAAMAIIHHPGTGKNSSSSTNGNNNEVSKKAALV